MTLELIERHRSFEGEMLKYRHHSELLECDMTFSLYLPTLVTKKDYSLIWWLSGLTCTDDNFTQKSGFQKYAAAHEVAVIMPDTSPRGSEIPDSPDWDLGQGASFYVNATAGAWQKNYQMYSYLTEELPTIVSDLIPNLSGKESIMGHSMGGHGALMVGLKNPSRFSAISAFAPILSPSDVPWGQKAFTQYLGTDEKDWKQWDATQLITNPLQKKIPILITQGTQDVFYESQLQEDSFLSAAKENKQNVNYQKAVGYDHSYFTIASFIEEHLNFHVSTMDNQ